MGYPGARGRRGSGRAVCGANARAVGEWGEGRVGSLGARRTGREGEPGARGRRGRERDEESEESERFGSCGVARAGQSEVRPMTNSQLKGMKPSLAAAASLLLATTSPCNGLVLSSGPALTSFPQHRSETSRLRCPQPRAWIVTFTEHSNLSLPRRAHIVSRLRRSHIATSSSTVTPSPRPGDRSTTAHPKRTGAHPTCDSGWPCGFATSGAA